jgi:hypothetical protein
MSATSLCIWLKALVFEEARALFRAFLVISRTKRSGRI